MERVLLPNHHRVVLAVQKVRLALCNRVVLSPLLLHRDLLLQNGVVLKLGYVSARFRHILDRVHTCGLERSTLHLACNTLSADTGLRQADLLAHGWRHRLDFAAAVLFALIPVEQLFDDLCFATILDLEILVQALGQNKGHRGVLEQAYVRLLVQNYAFLACFRLFLFEVLVELWGQALAGGDGETVQSLHRIILSIGWELVHAL